MYKNAIYLCIKEIKKKHTKNLVYNKCFGHSSIVVREMRGACSEVHEG